MFRCPTESLNEPHVRALIGEREAVRMAQYGSQRRGGEMGEVRGTRSAPRVEWIGA